MIQRPRRRRDGVRSFDRRGAIRLGVLAVPLVIPAFLLSGPPPGGNSADSASLPPAEARDGRPVTSEVVIRNCVACHAQDDEGRMSRISFVRKTPEGWQTSIQRMVALYNVPLDPDEAREVVRYLATYQGLAPEELEPGRFEVERRMVEFDYEDRDTERTCIACHSMGRVITQRRTAEEWDLLMHTHRALYPLVDRQAFYSGSGRPPVERAVEHLVEAYPFLTPEWAAWEANLRPARIEGSWTISGHEFGVGPVFGTLEIRPVPGQADEFTTEATYVRAVDGSRVSRTGRGIVYTGYQWRGRSATAAGEELREVLTVDRGWGEMRGRWFTGPHDEFGVDVRLRRAGSTPVIAGIHPARLRAGSGPTELTLYGANLPTDLGPEGLDLGPGVRVLEVRSADADRAVLGVEAAAGAAAGRRDAYLGSVVHPGALVVHDRVDHIRVQPTVGLARVGGIVVPKQYQPFEAIAYLNGSDGLPGTEDDLELGPVEVNWSLEEYPSTYDDDDVDFVGAIDGRGLFTPAVDGPNPERSGNRNNIGTVWVVARYDDPAGGPGAEPLTARAYLVVTAPLHIRWDGWALR